MTDEYAVIGHPVKHSKSPQIHAAFAEQTEQDLEYTAIEVPVDKLAESLQQLRDVLKLRGVNVTVPFKEQAFTLAGSLSDRARQAGAVNTIVFEGATGFHGDNTDGVGLYRDLTDNHGLTLTDRRILLLGAGGAARGVIAPLMAAQPAELCIANRTAEKADALAGKFRDLGQINGGGFEQVSGQYDLIINATAASLQGEMPPIPVSVISEHTACYDMMYGNSDTAFISWAKNHDIRQTMDGLGMLVEQAAESFYLWRGERPATSPVIDLLRQQLQQ